MVFFFPKLEVKRAVRNSARAGRYCLSEKQDAANHLIGGIISLHKAVVSQPLLSVEGGGASVFHRCPSKHALCLPAPEPLWALLGAVKRVPVGHSAHLSWMLAIPRKRILLIEQRCHNTTLIRRTGLDCHSGVPIWEFFSLGALHFHCPHVVAIFEVAYFSLQIQI